MHRLPRWARPIATSVMAIACLTSALSAQQGGDRTPRGDSLRQAQRLDIDGRDVDHHHDANGSVIRRQHGQSQVGQPSV